MAEVTKGPIVDTSDGDGLVIRRRQVLVDGIPVGSVWAVGQTDTPNGRWRLFASEGWSADDADGDRLWDIYQTTQAGAVDALVRHATGSP